MTNSSRWVKLNKALGVGLVILLWWLLSAKFAFTGMILSPLDTLATIGGQMKSGHFWTSIFHTLFDAITTFLFSFIGAFFLSITALRFKNLRHLLSPLLTTLLSAPTIAVIVLLILILPSGYLTTAVSFLVIFPLLFTNLLASFESAPTGELQAAQALGLSFSSRVVHIYLPNAFLLITANLNAAFTLNYKVVIAAEVLGQVGVYSIGSNILTAKQSLDFSGAFVWLVISVLLAFGLDYACKKLHQCIYARTLGSVV